MERKPDKSQIKEFVIQKVKPLCDEAVTQEVRRTDHYVVDVGSLAHFA